MKYIIRLDFTWLLLLKLWLPENWKLRKWLSLYFHGPVLIWITILYRQLTYTSAKSQDELPSYLFKTSLKIQMPTGASMWTAGIQLPRQQLEIGPRETQRMPVSVSVSYTDASGSQQAGGWGGIALSTDATLIKNVTRDVDYKSIRG